MRTVTQLCFVLLSSISWVVAQASQCPQTSNLTAVDDEALFRHFFPTVNFIRPVGNPQHGYQNLTWCCIAAVIDYLRSECTNSTDIQVDERILDSAEQFPCGAAYAGDADGAPVVRVTYNWTTSRCPGWQISQANSATQWLQTLVGFLLPSVVFALNVPRGYKFPLKDFLFAKGPLWQEAFFALVAMLSATIDTMLWLCVVFAMAGPLLLSGSLEALLDYNVIKYMLKRDEHRRQPHPNASTVPLAMRARILFTILGGNLELATAWKHVMNLAQDLDGLDNPTFDRQPTFTLGNNKAQEVDMRPSFRERIFSFDIDANDNLPDLQLGDSPYSQYKHVGVFSGEEVSDFSEALDPNDRNGSVLVSNARHTLTSDARTRIADDFTQTQQRPPLMTVPSREWKRSSFETDHYARSLPNDYPVRRHRYSGKEDARPVVDFQTLQTIPKSSSERPTDKQELEWGVIGRKYLETYKKEKRRKKTVGRIDQRLKAMLACQYSFGSTVGAPVVFYVGSFVYALIEILQAYGDNDVSHALAFGSWWMIIPHIATVSGLLLGGNNPNTLGAIIGAKERSKLQYAFGKTKPNSSQDLDDELQHETAMKGTRSSVGARHHSFVEQFHDHFLERVYNDSIYTPVSMWDRGRNKQTWLLILCAESWSSYDWYDESTREGFKGEILEFLQETVILSHTGRMFVMGAVFLLLFIPCTLGFLTAYFTPQVGVSCRSLTVVIYMVIQAMLLVLWGLHMTQFDEYWQHARRIVRIYQKNFKVSSDQLDAAFWKLRELALKDVTIQTTKRTSVWWQYTFDVLVIILPLAAILSAIGGTLMQIIGVFRSCFCKFNVSEWVTHGSAMATMSTNDQQDILLARHNWIAIGATGICFLSVTCFSGWWYQERARYSFDELAIRLGEDIQKRCAELDDNADSKVTVLVAK